MAVTITSLLTSLLPSNFYQRFIDLAKDVELETTDWESGSPTRTIFVYAAQVLGIGFGTAETNANLPNPDARDGIVSTFVQGGLLKFAAAVTPDPSVPQSDGTYPDFGTGFLDAIADGIYNVQRTGGPNGGPTAQTNASLYDACLAKLQADGPILATTQTDPYAYYATTKYAGDALTSPVTRTAVIKSISSSQVDMYLATATGVSTAADVQFVHNYLQLTCVPWRVTLIVHAATQVNAAIDLDVYVPAKYSTVASAAVLVAIQNYVNSVPIGGVPGINKLPISAIIAAIYAAVPYVQDIENFTINAVASDLTLAATECAVLVPAPVIRITGT